MRRYIFWVLAVAVCVACTEADIDEDTNNTLVADKIYATIDDVELTTPA